MYLHFIRLISLFILFYSLPCFAQAEKLVFAIDLIRHGDRTPVIDLASAPYNWPQGLGQLTARGMQQEFQLGKAWRKRYVEDEHLLPEHYSAPTLLVRSTDFDRTLMSAQSALLGLYPLGTGPYLPDNKPALDGAYQPVPIHTLPRIQETLLLPDADQKRYHQLLHQYIYTRADWKEKSRQLEPQFQRWTQLTGVKVNDLNKLIYLGDVLYVRQLYQLPLPQGMTESEATTIIDAGKWILATIYQNKEIAQLSGKPLLRTINYYLQQARKPKNELKFVLFSAHDSTILGLMSTIGAPLSSPPAYASDLNISLYEIGPGDYRVKVALNGQAVKVPACGGSVCRVSQFEKLVASVTRS